MVFKSIFDPQYWAAVPFHFWSVAFLALGCIVGSFLNVCIHRLPLGMSIVSPPSHCPYCKYSIPWWLNVPLFTWLFLRGRCRNCSAPISPRYFIVELLTGLMFLACWEGHGNRLHPYLSMPLALIYVAFISGLIVATFIDIEHFIIPDEITLGGAAVGIVLSFMLPSLHGVHSHFSGLGHGILGAAFGAGLVYTILRLGKLLFGRQRIKLPPRSTVVFTETDLQILGKQIPYEELLYRDSDEIVLHAHRLELIDRSYWNVPVKLSKFRLQIGEETLDPNDVNYMEVVCDEMVLPREAMGLGDVKFMGAIGAFIGWKGAIFSLMVSSMLGAVVGVALIVLQRREWSSRIPYGPYIAGAALAWLFGGKAVWAMIFAQ
jgi:leader peptidase (prepilin peptidase)/N-methyltransferase